MSVTALLRGKWGQKAQETTEKRRAGGTVPQSREDDDDEDDSNTGFSREPIRRNSRFYRSMRKKKKLVSTEQPESKETLRLWGASQLNLPTGVFRKQ